MAEEITQPTMLEGHYHYDVIRRAIEIIDAGGEDLSLVALADRLGMSAAHFQRVFSAWAGVSPKRYQQYLRLGHAKTLLHQDLPLLAAADTVGLSGTGRLHDLFLRWEAMTPGEYARKGSGLEIRHGWYGSPFGPALAMATPKGLCGLAFAAEIGNAQTYNDMKARWPKATFLPDQGALEQPVRAIFAARGEAALHLGGTPLQIKVWEALLTVPRGQAVTYGDIAQRAGAGRAYRAVGTAVGQNPLSWVIPCHRVLCKGGALGGYHWGTPIKRAMLAYETAQADARRDGPDRAAG